jgi:hypothetical protein
MSDVSVFCGQPSVELSFSYKFCNMFITDLKVRDDVILIQLLTFWILSVVLFFFYLKTFITVRGQCKTHIRFLAFSGEIINY